MNLHAELIVLLEKAKTTDEYFNPYLLTAILEAIEDTHSSDADIVPNELSEWAYDMFSR